MRHKNDKAILLDGVLGEFLRIIIHNFAIGNQLLRLSWMAMSIHDFLLENCDRHLRVNFKGQLLALQRLQSDFHLRLLLQIAFAFLLKLVNKV